MFTSLLLIFISTLFGCDGCADKAQDTSTDTAQASSDTAQQVQEEQDTSDSAEDEDSGSDSGE